MSYKLDSINYKGVFSLIFLGLSYYVATDSNFLFGNNTRTLIWHTIFILFAILTIALCVIDLPKAKQIRKKRGIIFYLTSAAIFLLACIYSLTVS